MFRENAHHSQRSTESEVLRQGKAIGQQEKTHREEVDLRVRNIEKNGHRDGVERNEHDGSETRIHSSP